MICSYWETGVGIKLRAGPSGVRILVGARDLPFLWWLLFCCAFTAACSESLYRLSYLLHLIVIVMLCAAVRSAVAYVEIDLSSFVGVTQGLLFLGNCCCCVMSVYQPHDTLFTCRSSIQLYLRVQCVRKIAVHLLKVLEIWKWCPRACIQAWTRLILFANTFCRSACEMFLVYAVIAVFNSITFRHRASSI